MATSAMCSSVLDKAFTGHLGWLLQTHDMKDAGSHIGQDAILNLCIAVLCHIDEWHRIERVRCIGGAISIEGIVRITVVGNDDSLVIGGIGS